MPNAESLEDEHGVVIQGGRQSPLIAVADNLYPEEYTSPMPVILNRPISFSLIISSTKMSSPRKKKTVLIMGENDGGVVLVVDVDACIGLERPEHRFPPRMGRSFSANKVVSWARRRVFKHPRNLRLSGLALVSCSRTPC